MNSDHRTPRDAGVVILGAGMAGFGAAHALHAEGVRARMYDDRAQVGGHTTSYATPDGFIFDDGPHISFTEDARIQELLAESVGHRFERIRAYVNNYWQGHWFKHPAHANLHGLPTELVIRCVEELVAVLAAPQREVDDYQQWLEASYGPTFANTFPAEYTKKYHTTEARNLTTDWIGPRLYRGSLEQVLRGALEPETQDLHYVDRFRYPTNGGFVAYLNRFLPLADQHYRHTVTQIDPRERTIQFANGAQTGYQRLVCSIPLPRLLPLVTGAPEDARAAAARLAATQAVIVNLGVARETLARAHWTYFYDADICFSRLSFPHLLSPNTVPAGCASVQAEIYFSDKYRPLPAGGAQQWIEPVVRDLVRCGLFAEDERIVHRSAWVTSGNVIFDHERAASLSTVHGYLDDVGIAYCGRYGDWGYMWTDESFLSGERAARKVLQA